MTTALRIARSISQAYPNAPAFEPKNCLAKEISGSIRTLIRTLFLKSAQKVHMQKRNLFGV